MADADDPKFELTPEPLRLLLVEDEPTQQLILARKLARAGYRVDTAVNGREAFDKLLTGSYSLLITDWDMPVMDGAALCRELRNANLPGYVYTLLLTSRDGLEHVVAGLQAGADDYLIKPVHDVELTARLATGRRIVELERSLRAATEDIRRLSVTDPLTGVYNRRYLMDTLPREIERAIRYQRQLSLIMCDVDHFKRINDTYGHQAGDDVLCAMVRVMQRTLRSTDWLARYGGEEFVIVLPETRISDARVVADHALAQIDKESFTAGVVQMHATVSLGLVGWEGSVPPDANLDTLIARCDACMYASKAEGRNRVTATAMD